MKDLSDDSASSTFSSTLESTQGDPRLEKGVIPILDVTIEDAPPDGGYGWICTIATFLINVNTWGVNSSWGIFLAHYLENDTFKGATRLEYALIGGLSISQSLMCAPLVAFVIQRLGTRVTMLIGAILVAVAMLGASFATEIWHLFLTQGCCAGYGTAFIYITASNILPQWFTKHRSLALGIASSGAGFGGLAYNLGMGVAVESLGWRTAYRILFIILLVLNLGCAMLLKDRNSIVKPEEKSFSLREYCRTETWLVILWGATSELGYIVLLFSLPNYAISIGLTAKQGSVIAAALNLGLALGRPFVGYWSDRFGRINVAAIVTGLSGVFCLAIWVPAKTYPVLIVFALLSGTVCGTFWSAVMPVTAEVVGLKRLPSTFTMLCLPLVIPVTFAEPIALQMVSVFGYTAAQTFVGCMFLAGGACAWALRSWKIHDMDKNEANGPNGAPSRLWLTRRGLSSIMKV